MPLGGGGGVAGGLGLGGGLGGLGLLLLAELRRQAGLEGDGAGGEAGGPTAGARVAVVAAGPRGSRRRERAPATGPRRAPAGMRCSLLTSDEIRELDSVFALGQHPIQGHSS